jgi:NADH-quinone oxidoreductase subunit G
VQICPVGALTGTQYRFRSRPFDLVSTPSACEHCSAGCAQRTDWRRHTVLRRLAGDDPAVNEEWNCDKGRWGFLYATAPERIEKPLVRDARSGELREASWPEALSVAAAGLREAREKGVGVLTGGRLTVEDAYAYSKFARLVLGSNDIDFRARPHSAEEAEFLAAAVVGRFDVRYEDIDTAPVVLIAGLEPEEECPILFLRLRKAVSGQGQQVHAIAPYASRGLTKLSANVRITAPGGEASVLAEDQFRDALATEGAMLIVGERLATVPGALTAAAALAERTGAKLAWVPRRAGDRGAVEAGCLPNLLPGGRSVSDPVARAELATAWGVDSAELPSGTGRDTDSMLVAAADDRLGALVVAGVDPGDLADPRLAADALDQVDFLVSLELRETAVTRRADVVLPVAPTVEKAGTFLSWEGRPREFGVVLRTVTMSDARVLEALAREFGVELGTADPVSVREELAALPPTRAPRPTLHAVDPPAAAWPGEGEALLATWHQLLDMGTLTEGDGYLLGTARPAVVRISKQQAAALNVADGAPVTVGSHRGLVTLPALITDDLPDGVVWLPTNSPGSTVHRTLGVTAGAIVSVSVYSGGTA